MSCAGNWLVSEWVPVPNAMITTFSLQSGSNGNAIYVETPDARLLVDAGISGKQARLRMASHGRDIHDVHAVIVSHDHRDHVRAAGIYQRKFALPMYLSKRTFDCASWQLGTVHDVRLFATGDTLRFGDTLVHTVPTPHDATDGCCFVIECAGVRLGLLTDLGHVFASLEQTLGALDAAYVESNYDPDMLARGPYTPALKRRIRGDGGHLSNAEAAELVDRFGPGLRWVALAHLSEQNNTPELAADTWRARVRRRLPLHLAGRHGPSDVLCIP